MVRHKVQDGLREVNIAQALIYPFLRNNQVNTFVLPGAVALCVAFSLICFGEEPWISFARCFALIVFLPCLMGYGWRLVQLFRQHGYDAPAPDWTLEKVAGSWWDGLKLMPLLLITVAPMVMLTQSITQLEQIVPTIQMETTWLDIIPAAQADNELFTDDELRAMAAQQVEEERKERALARTKEQAESRKLKELPVNTPNQSGPLYDSLKQLPNLLTVLAELLCTALIVLFMPFAWGSVIHAADCCDLTQLVNIGWLRRAGSKCYRKALLASLAITFFFPTCLVMIANMIQGYQEWFLCLLGPTFVAILFSGFHLITQAYDGYREHASPVKQRA